MSAFVRGSTLALLCSVNASMNLSPRVQLRQGNSKLDASMEANTTELTGGEVTGGAPMFQFLVKEWKKMPKLDVFLERCEKIISKLMPRLQYEYTALNVPKVLLHDCDVYATKEDYKTINTDWDSARLNCRVSARKLSEEFNGDKNYRGWCEDLHALLLEQSNLHIQQAGLEALRKQYEDMLKKEAQIAAEVDDLKKCCRNCRVCTAAEMESHVMHPAVNRFFF
eukprot:gnl/MRDRNA2_/MRDRNA2_97214_c0_seq1.p1 gnl/MRDRNA2_/MRDRNA2_97214_c0~~gnl/MRDRNA2_/MRDRNA2_97214_c0_seq1.p1  ORF type:complete len:224 (+),score=53.49 gnl/MRDRNA2_/MRDRNA2_97214_c0_seq1:88-759(+)